jgi:hypothetical protein
MLPGFARMVQVFDSFRQQLPGDRHFAGRSAQPGSIRARSNSRFKGRDYGWIPYLQVDGITFVIPRLKLSYRVCKFLVKIQPCPCET